MLREVGGEDSAEPGRRWFSGRSVELVVWEDDMGVRLYHLRYRRDAQDGVFEWKRGEGLFHHGLDDGEGRGGRAKATPVLGSAPAPDLGWVRDRFRDESQALEPALREHVERTLGAARAS